MKLSPAEEAVLRAMAQGGTLKTHRSMDGEKLSKLHPLDASAFDVDPAVVESLKRRKLIRSNMKFPAATYLLTDRGRFIASGLADSDGGPLGPHNYVDS
jgi:uncharacterized protein YjhX (UPF0386 family)